MYHENKNEIENEKRDYILHKKIMKISNLRRIKYSKTLNYIIQKNKIKNVIIIQKNVRKYLKKLEIDDENSQIRNSDNKYINDETILGDKIENIEKQYFYTTNNFAFDIREIYKNNFVNPYTNIMFDEKIIRQIKRIIRKNNKNNYSIEIKNAIPCKSELSVMISNFFNKMLKLKTYPNVDAFHKYNIFELFIFICYLIKFEIIKNCVTYHDIKRLKEFYQKCEDDDANDINEFKFYVMILLNKILNDGTQHLETIALIISESMVIDIIQAYYNREYEIMSYYLSNDSSNLSTNNNYLDNIPPSPLLPPLPIIISHINLIDDDNDDNIDNIDLESAINDGPLDIPDQPLFHDLRDEDADSESNTDSDSDSDSDIIYADENYI